MLTLHTTGDGVVSAENEKAYATVVHEANNSNMLRERFIHRAGHCEFSPAEMITALQKLEMRLAKGRWPASQLPIEQRCGAGPELQCDRRGQCAVSRAACVHVLSTAAISQAI